MEEKIIKKKIDALSKDLLKTVSGYQKIDSGGAAQPVVVLSAIAEAAVEVIFSFKRSVAKSSQRDLSDFLYNAFLKAYKCGYEAGLDYEQKNKRMN